MSVIVGHFFYVLFIALWLSQRSAIRGTCAGPWLATLITYQLLQHIVILCINYCNVSVVTGHQLSQHISNYNI